MKIADICAHMAEKIKIAIFASGTGSNAKNLINSFSVCDYAKIELMVCNNPRANAVTIAHDNFLPCYIPLKNNWNSGIDLLQQLKNHSIDLIVLAGFLWKIPENVIHRYPDRIINIHPSLLPKFGGKGMYGRHVHEAVLAAGEKKSGITIHLVNEEYDKGRILFQKSIDLNENESSQSLAERINELELLHFPEVVLDYIQNEILSPKTDD
jgi:phosphoribosylglycinamide formyltransferase-1